MGRSIGAIVFGLAVAVLWVAALEWINSRCFPQLAGVDLDDRETVARILAENPRMLMGLALAYFVSTFIGAWIAGRTAKRKHVVHGLIVGLILFGVGIMNMTTLPHPVWFWFVGLATFPIAGLLGGWVASKNASKPSPGLS
jgi:putative membrane protein (TIGR04086 family)